MIQRRQALMASLAATLAPLDLLAQGAAIPRLALIVGNGAYRAGRPLKNPANDARAMSALLTEQGFDVVQVLDGTRQQMQDALAQVQAKLNGAKGVGLLYYAGHGLQLSERNFLIPVDARIASAADVPAQAIDVQSIVNAYRAAGCRMNILVLDACRDDPFGASTLKGLAPLDAPAGTFIAYATGPGNVAEDGESQGNGLYTSFLLQELKRPQASIEQVFKRVRYRVRQKSEGRQIPWESTSLEEEFSFSDGRVAAITAPTVESVQRTYPAELEAWKRIASSQDPADFFDFLQRYPTSSLAMAAQGRIDELKRSSLVVQGAAPDGGNAPVSIARVRKGQRWSTRSQSSGKADIEGEYLVRDDADGGLIVETKYKGSANTQYALYNSMGAFIGVRTFDAKGNKLFESIKDKPSYLVPPGLLQVGQRWSYSDLITTKNGEGTAYASTTTSTIAGEGRVVSREPIVVGAGTFDTFLVVRKYQIQAAIGASGKTTTSITEREESYWMTLNMPPVKALFRTRSGTDAWTESTMEMTAYSPGGAAA